MVTVHLVINYSRGMCSAGHVRNGRKGLDGVPVAGASVGGGPERLTWGWQGFASRLSLTSWHAPESTEYPSAPTYEQELPF